MTTCIFHMNARGKIDQYLQVNPPYGRLQKVQTFHDWKHVHAHFTLVGQFTPRMDIKVRMGSLPLVKLSY